MVPPSEPVVAPALLLAVREAVELMVLLMVEELGLMGSCAPQGWFSRQADAQVLSPWPQLATHWFPHSWQTKKGMVWVYCVTLGEMPSPHTQE